ncbi:tetratricopeptide repeat protein [Candidatus Gracilibacteria bacterium]|nr:tetratricopeptide repeat protein [Candidatus Gracilibacteria bacterium]
MVELADLDSFMGHTVEFKQKIALAEITFGITAKLGINTDLEKSLFLSDHDIRLPDALTKSERAYQMRPNIFAADNLVWALYKNNQFSVAAKYTTGSLILGENDALILYHQGMIALKNNNTIEAKRYLKKSLELNPRFSIIGSRGLSDTLDLIK